MKSVTPLAPVTIDEDQIYKLQQIGIEYAYLVRDLEQKEEIYKARPLLEIKLLTLKRSRLVKGAMQL